MPSRDLPARPNLDHLKHEAKALQNAFDEGDATARKRVRDVLGADAEAIKLTDAQRVIAREYGFPTWARLREHVQSLARTRRTGHRVSRRRAGAGRRACAARASRAASHCERELARRGGARARERRTPTDRGESIARHRTRWQSRRGPVALSMLLAVPRRKYGARRRAPGDRTRAARRGRRSQHRRRTLQRAGAPRRDRYAQRVADRTPAARRRRESHGRRVRFSRGGALS